jgi:hypothetical protein
VQLLPGDSGPCIRLQEQGSAARIAQLHAEAALQKTCGFDSIQLGGVRRDAEIELVATNCGAYSSNRQVVLSAPEFEWRDCGFSAIP